MGSVRKVKRADLIRENAELKEKLKAVRTSRLASNLTVLLKTAIIWGAVGYTIIEVAKALAGQATYADVDIDVAAQLLELAPPWWLQVATFIVMAMAIRSNRRYRTINSQLVIQVSEKTRLLELSLDPSRTSSGLGHDGETNKRDDL
ncbi:hypothetical protein ACW5F0_05980 [Luteimonas sp. A534]